MKQKVKITANAENSKAQKYLFSDFLKKIFILFLDREEGRKKERERNINVCGCLLYALYWGPGLQPRDMP